MSARFTYVSPAGTLVKDGEVHGRVVDGGYFENSEATTTLEVLLTIDQLALRTSAGRRWNQSSFTLARTRRSLDRPSDVASRA